MPSTDAAIPMLNAARRRATSGARPRVQLAVALPLSILALGSAAPTQAAGVNPLPAVARALSGVTSYQVIITSTTSGTGRRPRPTGTPRAGGTPRARRGRGRGGIGLGFGAGPQTRTIVAVRKGNGFEDYVVVKGKTSSGKASTTRFIVYGGKMCTRSSSARSYACRTASTQFNIDPTTAFAAGAGSTTFTRTSARTIGGQACDGYAYANVSSAATARGVVYVARRTHLPCEQDAVVTRHFPGGSAGFTQKSTTVWSRFDDKRLAVPPVPTA